MFMSTWVLEISNWHPARLNQWDGRHWSVRNKLKKQSKKIIFGAMLEQQIPKATGKRQVQLFIGLGYRQRGGDPDSYFKDAIDALVHNGLLVNDSKEWVEVLPVKYDRTVKPMTRITLIDI